MREGVCLACGGWWRRGCGGYGRGRGAHGRAAASPAALWEHHRFGPRCWGSQLSEGRYRRGEGGGGQGGGRGRRQGATWLTLGGAEGRGHVTGRGGAALKWVCVGGAPLVVP